MQCTAKSKRSGEQCKKDAMRGSTKCHMHGGKSPKGIASPAYQTGRYSKYLPARLMERYQEASQDSELLALREDIALLDTRLADLLKRVDSGEAGAAWKEARAAYKKLSVAIRDGDKTGLLESMADLETVIGRGWSDYMAWSEIQNILDQRRRLVESEQKRLVQGQMVITGEQAMILATALLDSVRRNVSDFATLNAIQNEFVQLVNSNHQQRINSRNEAD